MAKRSKRGMSTEEQLKHKCKICGAPPGEWCQDSGVPLEAQPGVHAERGRPTTIMVDSYLGILRHRQIGVVACKAPPYMFLLESSLPEKDKEGTPNLELEVKQYVRLDLLPTELQQTIRDIVGKRAGGGGN